MFEQENYHPTNKIINGDPFQIVLLQELIPVF